MEQFNRTNKMLGRWISMEHYRLHCVEAWADSPYKEAVLAAIHSSLERFKATAPSEPKCMVCATRRTESVVLEFPSRSQRSRTIAGLAA
jgi:hypothetical protein